MNKIAILRQLIIGGLLLGGFGLMVGSGYWLLIQSHIYAQEPTAEYVGARECGSCHRDVSRPHAATPHALALQKVSEDQSNILGDFSQGQELRRVPFPREITARPFVSSDVAYIVGSGRHTQRYLYATGDNQYLVLPVQWNVETQSWEPYTLAENWPDPAYDWGTKCAGCHTTGLKTEDFTWQDDGVQCEACHGPGSRHIEAADNAGNRPSNAEVNEIRSRIYFSPDPQVCGRCHSAGVDAAHGLSYPADYVPGTALSETFTLAPTDDTTHWWASGHARARNMQFNEWLNSAHARSLETLRGSPLAEDACLICHSGDYRWNQAVLARFEEYYGGDPPAALTLETAQLGVVCLTCHLPHPQDAELAATILTDDLYQLCTTCHSSAPQEGIHHPVREMFEGTALVEGIEGTQGIHFSAENGPDCLTCHASSVPIGSEERITHALKPILPGKAEVGQPNACSACHDDLTTSDLQFLIDDIQTAVLARLTSGRARLTTINPDALEGEAQHQYDRVVDALNFVQNDGSLGVHNYAYADALLDFSELTLTQLSVPGARLEPTEAPAPTAVAPRIQTISGPAELAEAQSVRPMTVFLIGITVLILLVAAVALFRRPKNRQKDAADE